MEPVSSSYISRSVTMGDNTDFSSPWGYLGLAGAVFFFGSFNFMIKLPCVVKVQLDPMVFQLYFSFSVAVVSCLTMTYNDFYFSWWAVIGAVNWVLSQLVAYVTVHLVGVSIGPLVWSGTTILVSFIWGQIWFHESINQVWLALLAIIVVIVSLIGAGLASSSFPEYLRKLLCTPSTSLERADSTMGLQSMDDPLIEDTDANLGHWTTEEDVIQKLVVDEEKKTKSRCSFFLGILGALVMGIMNGSLLIPYRYYADEMKNVKGDSALSYVAAFALSVAAVTPFLAVVYFIVFWKRPVMHWKVAIIPGLYTGFMWSIGNLGSIYATKYLGNSVGYPLTQTAVLINGMWGVFYYKEIRGCMAITMFGLSSICMLGGAGLLVFSAKA